MTSMRPYFVRAIYEWILDNQFTPYLLVNAMLPSVQVPTEHVRDGRIILNLAPSAIRGLVMDNDRVEFSARFGGVARTLYLPISAVLAIYAKENGRGMFFDENEMSSEGVEPSAVPAKMDDKPHGVLAPVAHTEAPHGSDVPPSDTPTKGGKGAKKRPSLKVVK
ncbi:Stringent starvation protein B [gamma proteobacterium HdN1]|nr:Stringent starvation protein B [gamma proteobacterium HdN1]